MKAPDINEIHREHGPDAARQAFDDSIVGNNVHEFPCQRPRNSFILLDQVSEDLTKAWIVDDWLGAGEASVVFGKPGDAKSVFVEDLGLHVAYGLPWHGHTVKKGAVVYVALERSRLVERRGLAFRLAHGSKRAPFAIVDGVHDLRDPRAVSQLLQIIGTVEDATGEKVVLIIIDTLSRALCGGDENSPKDMGAIVNSTSLLQARTSAHICWVHHTPIDGSERLRGHSALLGAVDLTIHVARNGDLRTATIVKSNDGEEGGRVTFNLESIAIGKANDGKVTTAPIVRPVEQGEGIDLARRTRLPKGAEITLRALHDVIADHGEIPPTSTYIPSGTATVSIDTWRQHAYRRGISGSEEARAKQLAFKRALEALLVAGRVATYDDKVWLVT